ncbi:hypothetical protein LINGRAHAP2_LOCUS22868, partial [Linum grandiflorum]
INDEINDHVLNATDDNFELKCRNLQEADETIQPNLCQVLDMDPFTEVLMSKETAASNLSLVRDSEHSPSYPHRHRPQNSNHKHGGRSARWSRCLDSSSPRPWT